jgi:hypothetical protein
MTKPGQPPRPRFVVNRLLASIPSEDKLMNAIQTQTAKPVYQKSASIIYLPPLYQTVILKRPANARQCH